MTEKLVNTITEELLQESNARNKFIAEELTDYDYPPIKP
jgi:hypothetical protein